MKILSFFSNLLFGQAQSPLVSTGNYSATAATLTMPELTALDSFHQSTTESFEAITSSYKPANFQMDRTRSNLTVLDQAHELLTSGRHAAVNFGEYIIKATLPATQKIDRASDVLESDVYTQVQNEVRAAINKDLIQSRFRRSFSMTNSARNIRSVKMAFDVKTGLRATRKTKLEDHFIIQLTAHVDDNMIVLDPSTLKTIKRLICYLDKFFYSSNNDSFPSESRSSSIPAINPETIQTLNTLYALIDLDRREIATDQDMQLTHDEAGNLILPAHVQYNKSLMRNRSEESLNMTWGGPALIPDQAVNSGEVRTLLFNENIIFSTFDLNEAGRIVADVSMRPPQVKARALPTQYQGRVMGKGSGIAVFLSPMGQILWYDPNDFNNLNPRQKSMIRQLANEAKAEKEALIQYDPLTLDVLLQTPKGIFAASAFQVLQDFKSMDSKKLHVPLIADSDEALRVADISTGSNVIQLSDFVATPRPGKTQGRLILRRNDNTIALDLELDPDWQHLKIAYQEAIDFLTTIYSEIYSFDLYHPKATT